MRLYHCSNMYFDSIDLTKSKPNKDFGKAFYLSEHASEIEPVGKAKVLLQGGNLTMLEYEFDETLLTNGSLNFKRFDGYNSEWAEFIFANRDYKQDFKHDYDVVYGPIANDNVGEQIRKFRSLRIPLEQFIEELKYAKGITFQYAFCTQKAIDCLNIIRSDNGKR